MSDSHRRRHWSEVATSTAVLLAASGAIVAQGGGATALDSTPTSLTASAQLTAPLEPPIRPLPDPDSFVRRIDNPYMPWLPGSRWVYVERTPDGVERIVVKVTDRTRRIEGIRATVVHDVVRLDGKVIENTFDWYAQDWRGNVWYLGEATKSYEDGEVSTEGSWEAGVDGAKAGVAMPGCPRVGRLYWQEYYAGHAEDQGKVLAKSNRVVVPAGRYRHALLTSDTTPLEPAVQEFKFYAPGVGVVLEVNVSPEQGRGELVQFSGPTR